MPSTIKHIAAAKALLRLFDDTQSLEVLSEKYHAYETPLLERVHRFIFIVDLSRGGQLFPDNPSLQLLEAAYSKGLRLQLIASDNLSEDEVQILLNNIKIITVIVSSFEQYGSCDELWKELHRATYGVPRPAYTSQAIAAAIINKFSQKLQECDSRVYVDKKFIITRFIVSRDWNLKSIDEPNLGKLLLQLQDSLKHACEEDIKFKVLSSGMYFANQTFYKTVEETCHRSIGKTVLQLGLEAPSHTRLKALDLQTWLDALSQYSWDFNLAGNTKTKKECYSIFLRSGYLFDDNADKAKAKIYRQAQLNVGHELLPNENNDSVEIRVLTTNPRF